MNDIVDSLEYLLKGYLKSRIKRKESENYS